jgi:DnaJ family protein A protein 5
MEEEVGVEHRSAPSFGDAYSSKEDVYAFYKFWENFTTIKQFAYVDEYDSRQAPNRRIKRLIEADNQKARNKERGKFNDTMRSLLSFIKNKDHRMQ